MFLRLLLSLIITDYYLSKESWSCMHLQIPFDHLKNMSQKIKMVSPFCAHQRISHLIVVIKNHQRRCRLLYSFVL